LAKVGAEIGSGNDNSFFFINLAGESDANFFDIRKPKGADNASNIFYDFGFALAGSGWFNDFFDDFVAVHESGGGFGRADVKGNCIVGHMIIFPLPLTRGEKERGRSF